MVKDRQRKARESALLEIKNKNILPFQLGFLVTVTYMRELDGCVYCLDTLRIFIYEGRLFSGSSHLNHKFVNTTKGVSSRISSDN